MKLDHLLENTQGELTPNDAWKNAIRMLAEIDQLDVLDMLMPAAKLHELISIVHKYSAFSVDELKASSQMANALKTISKSNKLADFAVEAAPLVALQPAVSRQRAQKRVDTMILKYHGENAPAEDLEIIGARLAKLAGGNFTVEKDASSKLVLTVSRSKDRLPLIIEYTLGTYRLEDPVKDFSTYKVQYFSQPKHVVAAAMQYLK
jgi:hypothetical protein